MRLGPIAAHINCATVVSWAQLTVDWVFCGVVFDWFRLSVCVGLCTVVMGVQVRGNDAVDKLAAAATFGGCE